MHSRQCHSANYEEERVDVTDAPKRLRYAIEYTAEYQTCYYEVGVVQSYKAEGERLSTNEVGGANERTETTTNILDTGVSRDKTRAAADGHFGGKEEQ